MQFKEVLGTLYYFILVANSRPHHHDYHDDYDDEDYVDYHDRHHHSSNHVIIIKTNDLLNGAAAVAASSAKPKTSTRATTTTRRTTKRTTTRRTTTTTTPKTTTTTRPVVRNMTVSAEYIVVDHDFDHGGHDYELHRGEDRYFDQYRDREPDQYFDHERDHDIGHDVDHDNDHFRRRVEENVVDSPEHHRHRHHVYRHHGYHYPHHHHVGIIEVEVPPDTTPSTTTSTTTTPTTTTTTPAPTTTPPNEECSFQVDLKVGQVKSLPCNTSTVKWLRMPKRNRRACSMRGVLMLRPPKKAKAVKFVMTFENPFRYSFHIADTPENKGWGSNEGEDRFDAEIFSWDNDLLIYKSSYGRHRIVNNHRDWINDTISVQVARNVVNIRGSESNQTMKYTDSLFHFKPTKSQKLIFLGLNRVVHSASGKPYRGRHGSGLCSACIIFK